MNKISLSSLLIFALTLTVLSDCGGGGGGGGGSAPPQHQSTSAVITLSSAVTGAMPANTIIEGYDVTITLPAGVTVRNTVNPPETDLGVVTASGAALGSYSYGDYSIATNTVRILIVANITPTNPNGFNAGEFSTVNCEIAAGHFPTASDFQQLTNIIVSGSNINNGSTVDLAPVMSITAAVVLN